MASSPAPDAALLPAPATADDLPDCALRRILSLLPPSALCAAARVCRRWAALAAAPPLLPAWLGVQPRHVASWRTLPPAVAFLLLTHAPSSALLAGPDLLLPANAWPALAAARFPPSAALPDGGAPHRGAANAFLATLLRQEALLLECNRDGARTCPTALMLHPSGAAAELPRGPHAPTAECTHAPFLRALLHVGAPAARRAWLARDVRAGMSEAARLEQLHASFAAADIFEQRAPAREAPRSLPPPGASSPRVRLEGEAAAEAGAAAFCAFEERVSIIDWRGPLRVYVWHRVAFAADGAVAAAAAMPSAAAHPRWQRNAVAAELLRAAAVAGALSAARPHDGGGGASVIVGRALLFCALDGAHRRVCFNAGARPAH
jgi:hypothetical protein